MKEHKITVEYYPEGGATLDLSNPALSWDEKVVLGDYMDHLQVKLCKRIIELLEGSGEETAAMLIRENFNSEVKPND